MQSPPPTLPKETLLSMLTEAIQGTVPQGQSPRFANPVIRILGQIGKAKTDLHTALLQKISELHNEGERVIAKHTTDKGRMELRSAEQVAALCGDLGKVINEVCRQTQEKNALLTRAATAALKTASTLIPTLPSRAELDATEANAEVVLPEDAQERKALVERKVRTLLIARIDSLAASVKTHDIRVALNLVMIREPEQMHGELWKLIAEWCASMTLIMRQSAAHAEKEQNWKVIAQSLRHKLGEAHSDLHALQQRQEAAMPPGWHNLLHLLMQACNGMSDSLKEMSAKELLEHTDAAPSDETLEENALWKMLPETALLLEERKTKPEEPYAMREEELTAVRDRYTDLRKRPSFQNAPTLNKTLRNDIANSLNMQFHAGKPVVTVEQIHALMKQMSVETPDASELPAKAIEACAVMASQDAMLAVMEWLSAELAKNGTHLSTIPGTNEKVVLVAADEFDAMGTWQTIVQSVNATLAAHAANPTADVVKGVCIKSAGQTANAICNRLRRDLSAHHIPGTALNGVVSDIETTLSSTAQQVLAGNAAPSVSVHAAGALQETLLRGRLRGMSNALPILAEEQQQITAVCRLYHEEHRAMGPDAASITFALLEKGTIREWTEGLNDAFHANLPLREESDVAGLVEQAVANLLGESQGTQKPEPAPVSEDPEATVTTERPADADVQTAPAPVADTTEPPVGTDRMLRDVPTLVPSDIDTHDKARALIPAIEEIRGWISEWPAESNKSDLAFRRLIVSMSERLGLFATQAKAGMPLPMTVDEAASDIRFIEGLVGEEIFTMHHRMGGVNAGNKFLSATKDAARMNGYFHRYLDSRPNLRLNPGVLTENLEKLLQRIRELQERRTLLLQQNKDAAYNESAYGKTREESEEVAVLLASAEESLRQAERDVREILASEEYASAPGIAVSLREQIGTVERDIAAAAQAREAVLRLSHEMGSLVSQGTDISGILAEIGRKNEELRSAKKHLDELGVHEQDTVASLQEDLENVLQGLEVPPETAPTANTGDNIRQRIADLRNLRNRLLAAIERKESHGKNAEQLRQRQEEAHSGMAALGEEIAAINRRRAELRRIDEILEDMDASFSSLSTLQ